ncbi:MAG: hypothetical protein JW934_08560 [Anaerolineae bacterium]|nr:hypothetical protein [Anaerolineae bacterium]
MSELLSVPAHLEINERIHWLLRLRWLTVLFVLIATLAANAVLPETLPVAALLITATAIALYNGILFLYVRFLERRAGDTYRQFTAVAHAQKILDLITLFFLFHFSGGLENPFLFFFVVPVINASIVFSRRASMGYAALAALLSWGLLLLEATGVIPHYNLRGYRMPTRYAEPLQVAGVGLALSSLLVFVSYFSSSVVSRLRQRTQELWKSNLSCQVRAGELAELNAQLAAANTACELRAGELADLNEQLAQANLSCELRASELADLNEQLAQANLSCELRAGELTEANQQLAAANEQLAEMNKKLKELDDARMQFTLLVTHELRAPVAAIHSYIKLILDGYVPEERQREILERSEQRAREQLDLIADLLELGKIQQRALIDQCKPVQVGEALQTVCETVRSWANDKEITIETEIEPGLPPVVAAPNHIKQLWMNLVSNGIKYTRPGGQVTTSVRQEGDLIVGAVQDTGIGISEKDQERIFQDFFRTDEAKTMERQGTGLGLSIVKRIVEIYGGEIGLHSEVGAGTTFTFKLPWAGPE